MLCRAKRDIILHRKKAIYFCGAKMRYVFSVVKTRNDRRGALFVGFVRVALGALQNDRRKQRNKQTQYRQDRNADRVGAAKRFVGCGRLLSAGVFVVLRVCEIRRARYVNVLPPLEHVGVFLRADRIVAVIGARYRNFAQQIIVLIAPLYRIGYVKGGIQVWIYRCVVHKSQLVGKTVAA